MQTSHHEHDPKDVGSDLKLEMGAVVVAGATFIVLMFMESYRFGVLWLMAALFVFGIWRIGKADLR
jgi:hypothetical protein